MMGIKRGWFNESWRHSLAAKGVSTGNKYFLRKARRIELSPENRFRTFRGDLLGERDRLRNEVKVLKEAARAAQDEKAGASVKERARLEQVRSSMMDQRLELKEQLRQVNQRIEQAYEAGELDPVERRKLLEEDREATKARTERAEEQILMGKAKATKERALILAERAAIDKERRRLGLPPIRRDEEETEFERMFGQFPSSGRTPQRIKDKKAEKAAAEEREREKRERLRDLPEAEIKFREDVESVAKLAKPAKVSSMEEAFEEAGLEIVDIPKSSKK